MNRADLKMTRLDIERRADGDDRMMLACSAPYVSFGYALERDWITRADYDAARESYGNLWNYCGD